MSWKPPFALVAVLLIAGCSGLGSEQPSDPETDATSEPETSSANAGDGATEEAPTAEEGGQDGFPAIAVGRTSTCMVRSTGDVACWGRGAFPDVGEYGEPVILPGYSDAEGVALLGDDPCVLDRSGSLSCGFLATEDPFADLGDVRAFATNDTGTCAVHNAGSVSCWEGLVGADPLASGADPSTTWEPVEGLSDAVAISGGYDHFCVVREGGSVACWGDNDDGQLGDGTLQPRSGVVDVEGVANAAAVAAGAYSTCVVDGDGEVHCWGGAGGDDGGADAESGRSESPGAVQRIEGLAAAVDIVAGEQFICALHANGSVSCLGSNFDGQLGDGTTERRSTPVRVRALDDALGVAAGPRYACALRTDNQYVCWGSNRHGQLGDGTIDAVEVEEESDSMDDNADS